MADEQQAEKLDAEKQKLEEKVKNLSKIIEVMSTKQAAAAKNEAAASAAKATEGSGEAAAANLKDHFTDLKKAIGSLETKIKDNKKVKPTEETTKLLATVQEKLTALDALPTLVEGVQQLREELNKHDDDKPENPFGAFGAAQQQTKEASLFFTELKSAFEEFRQATELKLEDLERRVNVVNVKLDTKTLKNLEQLAGSKDEIINTLIPHQVREEVDKILAHLSYTINNLTQRVNELALETEKANNKIEIALDLLERVEKR